MFDFSPFMMYLGKKIVYMDMQYGKEKGSIFLRVGQDTNWLSTNISHINFY